MHQMSSTGNGKDVEHIYSIMESIVQLSNSSTAFTYHDHLREVKQEGEMGRYDESCQNSLMKEEEGATIKQEDSIQSRQSDQHEQKQHRENLEIDSESEQQFLKHLSDATTSFSKRILNFEKLLLHLIQQSMYQTSIISNDNNNINSSNSMNSSNKPRQIKLEQQRENIVSSKGKNDMNELSQLGELTKQISILQNKNLDLESKIADLAKDRDVCKDSERRVRRGLYRVATGRMKIAEVLKVRKMSLLKMMFYYSLYSHVKRHES